MRPALLRILAGLLLLSWAAALAHVAHEGCAAATAGLAAASDADEEGHCNHGTVGDFAEGKFSGAGGGKLVFALSGVVAAALILVLPPSSLEAGGFSGAGELLDPGGGSAGWFMGGRPAHPVRGPSGMA